MMQKLEDNLVSFYGKPLHELTDEELDGAMERCDLEHAEIVKDDKPGAINYVTASQVERLNMLHAARWGLRMEKARRSPAYFIKEVCGLDIQEWQGRMLMEIEKGAGKGEKP